MSIHDEITKRQREGKLSLMMPTLEEKIVRFIYISNEVKELLASPFGDSDWDVMRAQAKADLDWFTAGHRIDVRFGPSKNVSARLARLSSAPKTIWEFRVREPRPGIRIFGGFADTDVFVALTWKAKRDLLDSNGKENVLRYRHAIKACETAWVELLCPFTPKIGVKVNEYISRKATLLV